MTEWYYEDSGQSRGPVQEAQLRTMLADGLLPGSTRVWHESFGQEWRTAAQAGFAVRPGVTPPPIASAAPRSAPPPMGMAMPGGAPAYTVAATAYTPTYANLIAASPLMVMGLEIVAIAAGVSPYDPAFERGGGFWLLILPFVFAYKDAKAISAAGLNPQGRTIVPFMLLTHIGYFWRRSAIAGLSWKPFWLWLGAAFIYIIWSVIIYA